MLRDNFTCQSCNRNKNQLGNNRLEIHHIDGNGSSKPKEEQNNSLDNLITLCHKCHYKVEVLRRGHPGSYKKSSLRWSNKFPTCIACGKTTSKHTGHGLCNRCYEIPRRAYKAQYYRNHYSKSFPQLTQ